jgi:hypothetical protein
MAGFSAVGGIDVPANFDLEMMEGGATFGFEKEIEHLAALGFGLIYFNWL